MTTAERVARLAAITEELAQLLTAEERKTYCDPIENLTDLIHDLELD